MSDQPSGPTDAAGGVPPLDDEDRAWLEFGRQQAADALQREDQVLRVLPLSDAEIAEIRQRHFAVRTTVALEDRTLVPAWRCNVDRQEGPCDAVRLSRACAAERTLRQAAEHRRQQALSLCDAKNETITAYARQLADLKAALAASRTDLDLERLRRQGTELALVEEQQARERAEQAAEVHQHCASARRLVRNVADLRQLRLEDARTALAACEARLAEAQPAAERLREELVFTAYPDDPRAVDLRTVLDAVQAQPAPPPVEEGFIGHATPFRVWSQQDTDPPAQPAARPEEGEA